MNENLKRSCLTDEEVHNYATLLKEERDDRAINNHLVYCRSCRAKMEFIVDLLLEIDDINRDTELKEQGTDDSIYCHVAADSSERPVLIQSWTNKESSLILRLFKTSPVIPPSKGDFKIRIMITSSCIPRRPLQRRI